MAMSRSSSILRGLAAFVLCCILVTQDQLNACAATREIEILNKIPDRVLDNLAIDVKPDAKGAVQLNVGGWRAVVFQRIAIPLVWTGAVEGDSSKVDDGWRAIDLAFAHQLDNGSFETADGKSMPPTDMSLWLEALCHALLIVQDSALGTHYARRITALKPKIELATAWLELPSTRKALLRGDFYNDNFFASNRLFVDATAFMTASRLLNDPAPLVYARQFLAQAVTRQTSDGVLPEYGGFDSSYQAVSLVHATYYLLQDPSALGLRAAIKHGMRREIRAVDSTGALDVSINTRTAGQKQVFGQVKTPDLRSIILGLYYSGAYFDDAAAIQAGGRVFQKTFHINPNQ
jgi:hypothetical protein